MTYRRRYRRPVLPVLVALFLGATTAGTASVLAKPLDQVTSDDPVLTLSLGEAVRAEAPTRKPPARGTKPGSPTTTAPTSSTTPGTTTPPATTTTAVTPTSAIPTSAPPPPTGSAEDQVVTLVNRARATGGCAALKVDAHLTAAAAGHSTDMSEREYFSHTTPEGVTFDQRIEAAGYASPGAENIARGQRSAASVMDAWMNSSGHRANILNCKLTTIGVGLDTDGYYWTQDFGY